MTTPVAPDLNSYYDQDRHVMLDFVPAGVDRVSIREMFEGEGYTVEHLEGINGANFSGNPDCLIKYFAILWMTCATSSLPV